LEAPIKQGIEEWLAAAKITQGRIFRAIRKNDKVWGTGPDESAIWQIVRHYAAAGRARELCLHDVRRSCARIYYEAQAPLKQIQFLLGTTSSTPPPATSTTSRGLAGRRSAK
jgi:integrase